MATPSSRVTVSPAKATERAALERLLQLYLHDFSGFAGIATSYGVVDENGLFSYPRLADYWRDEGRRALLFRVDGNLAGFALINRYAASGEVIDWSFAEFFVMRKYRRAGVGTAAAQAAMRSMPGLWEIPVADYNAPAQRFWRAAVQGFGAEVLDECQGDGTHWSGPILRLRVPRA